MRPSALTLVVFTCTFRPDARAPPSALAGDTLHTVRLIASAKNDVSDVYARFVAAKSRRQNSIPPIQNTSGRNVFAFSETVFIFSLNTFV